MLLLSLHLFLVEKYASLLLRSGFVLELRCSELCSMLALQCLPDLAFFGPSRVFNASLTSLFGCILLLFLLPEVLMHSLSSLHSQLLSSSFAFFDLQPPGLRLLLGHLFGQLAARLVLISQSLQRLLTQLLGYLSRTLLSLFRITLLLLLEQPFASSFCSDALLHTFFGLSLQFTCFRFCICLLLPLLLCLPPTVFSPLLCLLLPACLDSLLSLPMEPVFLRHLMRARAKELRRQLFGARVLVSFCRLC
mmetsp:Transcript_33473/g.80300  ORF Transcript_33473/g.80300 Transcript_33473/m.80300 type:complete len:249 (-) Transcript_33473:483-1229(-)